MRCPSYSSTRMTIDSYYYMTTNYWAIHWSRYRNHLLCTDLWFDPDGILHAHYFTFLDHEVVDDHEEQFLKELIDQYIEENRK